jgi:hypothetical protein
MPIPDTKAIVKGMTGMARSIVIFLHRARLYGRLTDASWMFLTNNWLQWPKGRLWLSKCSQQPVLARPKRSVTAAAMTHTLRNLAPLSELSIADPSPDQLGAQIAAAMLHPSGRSIQLVVTVPPEQHYPKHRLLSTRGFRNLRATFQNACSDQERHHLACPRGWPRGKPSTFIYTIEAWLRVPEGVCQQHKP